MKKLQRSYLFPKKKIITEFHHRAASSLFAALEPAYFNDDRFFEKKTEPLQKGHYTTVEQKEKTPA